MTMDYDTLVSYVLGSLTPEQEREVVEHLRANPEDAAWVRDMFEVVAEVALSQEPAEVPAGAEAALLERVRTQDTAPAADTPEDTPNVVTLPQTQPYQAQPRQAQPARGNAWRWLALAAALAVVAWIGLRPTYQSYQAQRQLTRLCDTPGTVCQTLENEQGESLGTLAQQVNNELFVLLESAPPDGQVYQAWEIVGDTPRSLGTFAGRGVTTQPLGSDSVFGISVEPPGGSPQPTSTPIVVVPLSG